MHVQRSLRYLDLAISALAGRQHGVVSYRQLLSLGLTRDGVLTRVRAGRLHRLHRGVYAIMPSHLLRIRGHWKAATLAIGVGAAISHRSAAAHLELLSYSGSRIDLTVPRKVKPREGITLHCCRALPEHHRTIKDAIPCTTVARTIADLAAAVPERLVERAIGQAEVLKLFDRRALEEILTIEPGRPGAPVLRALLGARTDPASQLSRSDLEEALVSICDRAGIDRPELNAPFTLPDGTPIEIDALWRRQRLALEVDSELYHSAWNVQVSDRRRDQQLTLAGMRPVRVTEDDLTRDAAKTALLLRGLLTEDESLAG